MPQLRRIRCQHRQTTAVIPKPQTPVPHSRTAQMIAACLRWRNPCWNRPSEPGLSILARPALAVWSSSEKNLVATTSSVAVVQASATAVECVTQAQINALACAVLRAPVFPSLLIGYKCLVHWHADRRPVAIVSESFLFVFVIQQAIVQHPCLPQEHPCVCFLHGSILTCCECVSDVSMLSHKHKFDTEHYCSWSSA